ncbi:MAG: hypothetical protein AAGJ18_19690 [Bacteroidota bacterium]
MRNFSLQKKSSKIRTLVEPPKKKPKQNWQQASWFVILGLAFLYLGYYVYTSLVLIQGTGMVELEKLAVQFTEDVEILEIYVEEGQSVNKGDTLFKYREESQDSDGNYNITKASKTADWLLRDKINMEKQIQLKRAERENLKTQIELAEHELEHQKEMILVGVQTTSSVIVAQHEKINLLEAKLAGIKREISLLRRHLKLLKQQDRQLKSQEINQLNQLSLQNSPVLYRAKLDGIIGQIKVREHEVCYEKQELMTIHQTNNISIKGYFDQNEIPYLAIGDELDIDFPGGNNGKGVVQNFYVSTYELPEEFQKKYEPTRRNVVVEILPVNGNEAKQWGNFYKMTVQLSKKKYVN